jgi:hypothetical protein
MAYGITLHRLLNISFPMLVDCGGSTAARSAACPGDLEGPLKPSLGSVHRCCREDTTSGHQ